MFIQGRRRKVLEVIITTNEIKINTKKVATILDMPSPSSLKLIQILNEHLVALSRFLARQAEQALLFFFFKYIEAVPTKNQVLVD